MIYLDMQIMRIIHYIKNNNYYAPGPGTGLVSAIGGRFDDPNLPAYILRYLELK